MIGFMFIKCGSMLVRRKNKKFCRGVLQCGVGYGIIRAMKAKKKKEKVANESMAEAVAKVSRMVLLVDYWRNKESN